MRSKKMDLADDINEERRKVAERCQNHIQVLETYGMLMRRCIARNKKDYAQENLKKAEEYLKKHVQKDDIILTMGAGTITKLASNLMN